MKNKKKIIIVVSAVLATFILGGVIVYAASYDSTQDPLVSLSYITNVFKKTIDTDVGAVRDRVTAAEKKVATIEKAIADGTIGGTVDLSGVESRLAKLESADTLTKTELDAIKKDLQSASALTATQLSALTTELNAAKAELSAAKSELQALAGNAATKAELQALEGSAATKTELESEVAELAAAIEAESSKVDVLIDTYGALLEALIAERDAGDNYGFVTVTLKKGERVTFENGASIILRGGKGSYSFNAGAYDATASANAVSGEAAKAEHIVVFEKDGVFTASADSTVIMVKGEYKIER